MPKTKLLVIGLGQDLRGDDAAGLEVVKRWQAGYPETAKDPELVVELSPLPGLSLLSFLECAEAAILVDAVRSGAPDGTLHVLQREDLAVFGTDARSAHGWGVAETLALGEELYADKLPKRISLLAIEAGGLELGSQLSTAVQNALPAAAQRLQELVMLLRQPGCVSAAETQQAGLRGIAAGQNSPGNWT